MPRAKKHPRNYVVSIRVSDEEKTALEEMTRTSSMSISNLMREALQRYVPTLAQDGVNQG
jgi:predicted transcriptional regulator